MIQVDDKFIGNIYIEISRRKIAKYGYVPYGPVIKEIRSEKLETRNIEVFKELRNFGKNFCLDNNLNYFKIDPMIDQANVEMLKKAGWKNSMAIGQAKDTCVTDLGKYGESEEAFDHLLADFKKDTRYYVNRARKNGVKVERVKSVQGVEDFIKLMQDTKERQGFENFDDSYYLKQWEYFKIQKSKIKNQKPSLCEIYVAYYEGEPIAGALMNLYNGWVNYSHGASTSDRELSKLGGPYFLHYKIMEEAIKEGFEKYNFWGIVPGKGFSMFKQKFPGEKVSYVGAFEVGSGKPAYYLNRLYDWWVYRDERY